MNERQLDLGPSMRKLLMGCGAMNLACAICFSPPYDTARRSFGLAEPDSFYLWVLSSWILAFGVAYFHQGWTGRADRSVLWLGAWGKGVFSGLLIWSAATNRIAPMAALAAIPDGVLAIVFALWLSVTLVYRRPS